MFTLRDFRSLATETPPPLLLSIMRYLSQLGCEAEMPRVAANMAPPSSCASPPFALLLLLSPPHYKHTPLLALCENAAESVLFLSLSRQAKKSIFKHHNLLQVLYQLLVADPRYVLLPSGLMIIGFVRFHRLLQ